jgi:DNA-binding NtrC family response regulator
MQVTDLMPTPPQVCHPDSDLGTVARMMPDRPPEQVSALRAEALNAPAEDGLMTAARHRGTVKAGQLDASFNAAPELLDAIVDVLDVRTAFPRLSGIVQKVLPHDALTTASFAADGQLIGAAATGGFPDLVSHGFSAPLPDDLIVGDLMAEALPVTRGVNPTETLVALGYRSVLSVSTRARDQVLTIGFWAKQPHAYDRHDLPLARWIAGHLAVAVSHEQLASAGRLAAENRPHAEGLQARVQMFSDELASKEHDGIIGQSPAWQDVLRKAMQVAATETTVLLTGESGTGKEVVARFIYRASARKRGRFVALNCAALPEQLLESELFGYERGAFTSAQQAKPGQIELAAGGVLFLDEVSEMSLSAQAKFLRVLQEREFKRLGGTRSLQSNVRVIAATNRNLRNAVEAGIFREDLYYRLHVFDIEIQPLRERRLDILPLSKAFLQEIGRSMGRPPARLTPEACKVLLQHAWPGNVRQLRNVLERAAILCEDGLIDGHHLALDAASKPIANAATDLNSVEREVMARVLRECRWQKSKAARRLGLSRTQLYSRIRKYGLEPPVQS